jgi:hypothetical protein
MNEQILAKLEAIEDQLKTILGALRGDPSDETRPGLFLRVDRLEQARKAHNRVLWTIITGGSAVVATVAGALIVSYLNA